MKDIPFRQAAESKFLISHPIRNPHNRHHPPAGSSKFFNMAYRSAGGSSSNPRILMAQSRQSVLLLTRYKPVVP
jgi:hypothetical protein